MKPTRTRIQTINGGSSRIKSAVFEGDERLQQILHGGVERLADPGLRWAQARAPRRLAKS